MYIKPIVVVINLAEETPVFVACGSFENDSNSCYS